MFSVLFLEIHRKIFNCNSFNVLLALRFNTKLLRNHDFITNIIHIYAYVSIVIICVCMESNYNNVKFKRGYDVG